MITKVQLIVEELDPTSDAYRKSQYAEQHPDETTERVGALRQKSPSLNDVPSGPPTRLSVSEAATRRDVETVLPVGKSLGKWIETFGGYESTLVGPDGASHPVSLAPWGDRNPSTTFLAIHFVAVDADLVGTKMTDRYPPGT